MASSQLSAVLHESLEKLLKGRVNYVTQASWVSLNGSQSSCYSDNVCILVLTDEAVHFIDQNFEKTVAAFKYNTIKRVLVDINHEQCFQLHFDFTNASADLTYLQSLMKRNISDFSGTAPAIFCLARKNLLNHLRMYWKTRWMQQTFEVAELPLFRADILKLSKKKSVYHLKSVSTHLSSMHQSMSVAFDQLKHAATELLLERTEMVSSLAALKTTGSIPPASDVYAIGGFDIWNSKHMNRYLLNEMCFDIDENFSEIRNKTGKLLFVHRNDEDARIEIEVSQRIEHTQISTLGQRMFLKQYAELILDTVIMKDLIMNEEHTSFVVMTNKPYNRRVNYDIQGDESVDKENFQRIEGWQLSIRTVHRDIFLIVIRESYLPPSCSHFRDYYVILYGGSTRIMMASRGQREIKGFQIISEIIDHAQTARHYKQQTIPSVVQSNLDSLVFRKHKDYVHFIGTAKMIPKFILFGIPYFISFLNHLKFKTTLDEKILSDLKKGHYNSPFKNFVKKNHELIDQLNEKLTPFEMVEKFLQRSLLINNMDVRMNWLQKLSFLIGFCFSGVIHSDMVTLKLFSSFSDDDEYYGRVLSFLLFMKDKGEDSVMYRSQNRFGLTISNQFTEKNSSNFTMYSSFTQSNPKKVEGLSVAAAAAAGANNNTFVSGIRQQPTTGSSSSSTIIHNFISDLQSYAENPKNYEFHSEIMRCAFDSMAFFKILFLTNQHTAVKSICRFIFSMNFSDYPLQLSLLRSIKAFLDQNRLSESYLQIFKEFLPELVQLCSKPDRTLMKAVYEAIDSIIPADSYLQPQLELLKDGGPIILVKSLDVVDLDQIQIILRLIVLLKNSLDIFIKIGLISKLLNIIEVYEEIEGLELDEKTLLLLEDMLLMIVKKQQLSSIPPTQKKIIFNLLKSTTSGSKLHYLKVMDLISEIFRKDAFLKQTMSLYVMQKIVNLIFAIDKQIHYEQVMLHAFQMLLAMSLDDARVKRKLSQDFALKGIVSIKHKAITNVSEQAIDSLNGTVLQLWDELYAGLGTNTSVQDLLGQAKPSSIKLICAESEDEGDKNEDEEQSRGSTDSIDSDHFIEKDKNVLIHSNEALSPLGGDDEGGENISPKNLFSQHPAKSMEISLKVLGKFNL